MDVIFYLDKFEIQVVLGEAICFSDPNSMRNNNRNLQHNFNCFSATFFSKADNQVGWTSEFYKNMGRIIAAEDS